MLDTFITRPTWLRDLVRQLNGQQVVLVGVMCDPAELRRRERMRCDRQIGLAEAQLAVVHPLVHQHGGYDLEIDTSRATPRECAQEVQDYLRSGATPTSLLRLNRAYGSTA